MSAIIGCKSTKYVPDGKYLLQKTDIETNTSNIKESDARLYLKQHPNLRILGLFRFHLGLYNLSGKNQDRWLNRWLRKIGEEPEVYDYTEKERSKSELERYFKSKGYINAIVTDTVVTDNKKAVVYFKVDPKLPYRIKARYIKSVNTNVKAIIEADSANSLIKYGSIFDYDVFDKERARISNNLRSLGYYSFTKDDIEFAVDSSLHSQLIVDTMIVKNRVLQNSDGKVEEVEHKQYRINNIYFLTNFINTGGSSATEISQSLDTIIVDGYYFMYNEVQNIDPEVILNYTLIRKGDLYNYKKVERTQVLLSSIQLVRYVSIRFEEVDGSEEPLLNCYIQLSPNKPQSFSVNLEGTNKSGNIGGGGIFSYKHRNIFKGAEVLDLKLRGARESQIGLNSSLALNSVEYGTEASLTYPQFIFPFIDNSFTRNIKSSTTFNISYNFQDRPDYDRTIIKSILSYDWKSKNRWSHSLDLLNFNYVQVGNMSSAFSSYIDTLFLKYSYEDHLIYSTTFNVTFSTKTSNTKRNSTFFRLGLESAGNTLYAINSLVGSRNDDKQYTLLSIPFSQYLKFDGESVFNQYIDSKNKIVYRTAFGIGCPYGNLKVLPFEKRYFSGGANSVRAWNVRSLGPGTFDAPHNAYYNQTGDIKIEGNVEYRFKLLWLLEGALFIDAGNTWTIREAASQPGGLFKFDSFFKEFGLGYGFGTRFDFSFFVFRFDMGIKAYAPERAINHRWVKSPNLLDDAAYHIAIGYPF